MNISAPFIRRPVGTSLLAAALFLVGAVAYAFLPVASLPAIDFPTIVVAAQRPGADPATMAATVAAPLERRLARIASVTELTSVSALGSTTITVQFALDRNIDSAARDVQAALNAAATDLPPDLPVKPFFRKVNQSGVPVLVLALTSQTVQTSAIYDATDSVIAQRISQIKGVAQVIIAGAEQPAIRVQVDPARLASMDLGIDQIAAAIAAANVQSPTGAFDGAQRSATIAANDSLATPRDYGNIVVAASRGAIVKLQDVAKVERAVRNRMAAGWLDRQPAVLLIITKQTDANVIETVDHIKALLPELQQWIPSGVDITVLSDRTQTIRASVAEIERTLFISVCLVMAIVFLFLRRATPMLAAGVTVPLSLVGAGAAIWLAGFSIDNLSLMALTISAGFVVDDAIVMIENIDRNIARGMNRLDAALQGARQIGFTVVSISLSLVAVFVPLLLMQGVAGRLLREFSLTLTFAIMISTIVSLTVTPMICAKFGTWGRSSQSGADKLVERAFGAVARLYARSLRPVIDHPLLTLAVIAVTITATVRLYEQIPKGNLPQDDIGLINGVAEASPEVSFNEMRGQMKQVVEVLLTDPDVAHVGAFIGSTSVTATINQGRLYVALKPADQRSSTSLQVIARLRDEFAKLRNVKVYMQPSQDLRTGARQSKGQFQFTLSDFSIDELGEWTPRIVEAIRRLPEVVDVSSDRLEGGLKADLVIDRTAASRMGVSIGAIDAALNSSFGQRENTIIYTQRNQYRVIIEAPVSLQRDPRDLANIYVTSSSGIQVPLLAVARVERGAAPLVVNHQGVLPATTISYNVAPGSTLEAATNAIERTVAELHPPGGLRAEFAGEAADFRKVIAGMAPLILAALVAVYIILGVLYESLIHPVTIISTLPSAGLGALLALLAFGVEFTIVAFIGILLLIGIVKKNGIMLVDFAIQAERVEGLSPHDAAIKAAQERFRPILMTTLSAMFGALPLAFAVGVGAEMRRPLGITIVGGLALSQVLTLYTTPVIYLLMSKLQRRRARIETRESAPRASAGAAE